MVPRGGSSMGAAAAALVALAASAAARSCASFWVAAPARRLGRVSLPRAASGGGATRVVTSNHKTGTYLSRCLARVLGEVNVSVALGGDHVSGGFGDAPYRQLNFARDPFVLVDSGYVRRSLLFFFYVDRGRSG